MRPGGTQREAERERTGGALSAKHRSARERLTAHLLGGQPETGRREGDKDGLAGDFERPALGNDVADLARCLREEFRRRVGDIRDTDKTRGRDPCRRGPGPERER